VIETNMGLGSVSSGGVLYGESPLLSMKASSGRS